MKMTVLQIILENNVIFLNLIDMSGVSMCVYLSWSLRSNSNKHALPRCYYLSYYYSTVVAVEVITVTSRVLAYFMTYLLTPRLKSDVIWIFLNVEPSNLLPLKSVLLFSLIKCCFTKNIILWNRGLNFPA